jgi:AGCS family alanine or glycine:cation symporter
LAMLSKVAFRLLKDYEQQQGEGKQPQLDPAAWSDLDIDPAAWRD